MLNLQVLLAQTTLVATPTPDTFLVGAYPWHVLLLARDTGD